MYRQAFSIARTVFSQESCGLSDKRFKQLMFITTYMCMYVAANNKTDLCVIQTCFTYLCMYLQKYLGLCLSCTMQNVHSRVVDLSSDRKF